MVVTNLNASGSGSFREAWQSTNCPKVILFGVAGLITHSANTLQSGNCDQWSVVGASAPDNISITGASNVQLKASGSHWTVDHLTVTGGDGDDPFAITGDQENHSFGIALNNTFIWSRDEGYACYPPAGEDATNMLLWQNLISRPYGPTQGALFHYVNNIHVNATQDWGRLEVCGSTSGPIANPIRMHFEENLYVQGPGSPSGNGYIDSDGASCTTLQVYEVNTRAMTDANVIQDCSNHACTGGLSAGELFESPIAGVDPTGFVPETIGATQGEIVAFSLLVANHVGSRPNGRFAYTQARIDDALNSIDGDGPESDYLTHISSNFINEQGGLGVISATPQTGYDPTSAAENPCGVAMPTGAAADSLDSTSGLTELHEWVIGCFYDDVMPSGYREDGLGSDWPAP
jgi:hypothetical protein